jgi:acylpyruvate hydrolase
VRLSTVRTQQGTRAARQEGDEFVLLRAPDVGALLADSAWRDAAAAEGRRIAAADADLAPVVPRPAKIICLGLNYRSHIEETGREVPGHPTLFAKFARALIGPRDPIVLPKESKEPDWEAELAFVVGRPVRRATEAEAEAAIAGYTILNDVSMRDWQFRTLQFLQGKTFEKTTPVGPALVTPDEVDDARDLQITCEIDGDTVQKARTSELLFSPFELVRYISTSVTLEPGDIVATGTPAGVGHARTPTVFLRPGQVVRTRIEGLGELVNQCDEG